jgi:hypothetical protein
MPIPVFCYFCVSEKLHGKYSRNWTKRRPKFLFCCHEHGVQRGEGGGARRQPHLVVARVTLWPRHQVVWAPGPPPDIALPPIYFLRRENPKSVGIHPRKVLQRRRHRRGSSGDRSICSGTLPGRGIAPGAIFIDFTAIFIAISISHDEEVVGLPRG